MQIATEFAMLQVVWTRYGSTATQQPPTEHPLNMWYILEESQARLVRMNTCVYDEHMSCTTYSSYIESTEMWYMMPVT